MTLTIPPELEEQAQQQASREGLSLEDWLQAVLKQELRRAAASIPSLQDELTPEEWVGQFREWAGGHDRTTPLLSDDAISRDSIYPDRL